VGGGTNLQSKQACIFTQANPEEAVCQSSHWPVKIISTQLKTQPKMTQH